MKLLFSLLLIIVSCALIKSQQFANFIPYQADNCVGEPNGVGFSVPVVQGQCIVANMGNQQQPSSWEFEVTTGRDGLPILLTYQYNNYQRDCSSNLVSKAYFPNGTCSDSIQFQPMFNGTIKGGNPTPQALVTLTSEPIYPSNSQVYSVYQLSAMGDCTDNNLLYSVTFTSNLEIDFSNGNTQSYYCKNGQPLVKYCPSGLKCSETNPSATCSQYDVNNNIYCTSN